MLRLNLLGIYKPYVFVGERLGHKKAEFSNSEPVVLTRMIFRLSDCIKDCRVLRRKQLHFDTFKRKWRTFAFFYMFCRASRRKSSELEMRVYLKNVEGLAENSPSTSRYAV